MKEPESWQALLRSQLFWEQHQNNAQNIDIKVLLMLATSQKSVLVLFNDTTKEVDYASSNINIFGYFPENLSINDYKSYFYQQILPEHSSFGSTLVEMRSKVLSENPNLTQSQIQQNICGLKFRQAHGFIRLAVRSAVFHSADDHQQRTLYSVHNVTHLLKDDFFWIRICTPPNTCLKSYIYPMQNFTSADLISIREKDILRLLAQGKNNQEIAQQLFLSPNTVNNHRQRILNKIGARDTTALIQLNQIFDLV